MKKSGGGTTTSSMKKKKAPLRSNGNTGGTSSTAPPKKSLTKLSVAEMKKQADELNTKDVSLPIAAELYRLCLQTENNDDQIRRACLSNLCSVCLRMGEVKEAFERANDLREVAKDWFRTYQRLGECYRKIDNPYAALTYFELAISKCTDEVSIKRLLKERKEQSRSLALPATNRSALVVTNGVFGDDIRYTVNPSYCLEIPQFLKSTRDTKEKVQTTKEELPQAPPKRLPKQSEIIVRKYEHTGIYISVKDKRELPSFIFESPEYFEPFLTEDNTYPASPWGLLENNCYAMRKADIFRKFTNPTLEQVADDSGYWSEKEIKRRFYLYRDLMLEYCDLGLPEVQWIRKRADWKMKRLMEQRTTSRNVRSYENSLVTFKLQMDSVERMERIFTCPGHCLLNVLAEKILIPVMGWSRSYHTYYFQQNLDGSLYGPQLLTSESARVDRMHQTDANFSFLHGWGVFIDDSKVRLCDLLAENNRGNERIIDFIYDLGDRNIHYLSLIACEPLPARETGTRLVNCLSGKMAGIPEDRNGLFEVTQACHGWFRGEGDIMKIDGVTIGFDAAFNYDVTSSGETTPEKMEELSNATNYDLILGNSKTYDFRHFDLAFTNQRLHESLGTRSFMSCSVPNTSACQCCQPNLFTVITENDITEVCAYCGRGEGYGDFKDGDDETVLRLCASCNTVKYCSVYCQRFDWKEHKKTCTQRKMTSEQQELDILHAITSLEKKFFMAGLMETREMGATKLRASNGDETTYRKLLRKHLRKCLDMCIENKTKKMVQEWKEAEKFRRAACKLLTGDTNGRESFLGLRQILDQPYRS